MNKSILTMILSTERILGWFDNKKQGKTDKDSHKTTYMRLNVQSSGIALSTPESTFSRSQITRNDHLHTSDPTTDGNILRRDPTTLLRTQQKRRISQILHLPKSRRGSGLRKQHILHISRSPISLNQYIMREICENGTRGESVDCYAVGFAEL